MEWINSKFGEFNAFINQFPKVFWLGVFYIFFALTVFAFYLPFLNAIANFNIVGTKPFYTLISENYNFIKWGVFVIPFSILLLGWSSAEALYYKLRKRKYYF